MRHLPPLQPGCSPSQAACMTGDGGVICTGQVMLPGSMPTSLAEPALEIVSDRRCGGVVLSGNGGIQLLLQLREAIALQATSFESLRPQVPSPASAACRGRAGRHQNVRESSGNALASAWCTGLQCCEEQSFACLHHTPPASFALAYQPWLAAQFRQPRYTRASWDKSALHIPGDC